ncbi:CLAVATA3/ESR (CLE)-related protein 25-like [Hibiscus syriacus]|uniref:CLAVATA3/ESR (CLE)-related protein 25-like n=1 Tax=Hibiscus syriacus TaxID=106335 RepID=UPI0019242596|nr:CLAVATA3/ESR (CLE)-related protein 25-like [Hibiscus syriacus]
MSAGNNCCLSFKALFGALVVLGFILVGTLQSEGNETTTKTTADEDDESWSWKGKATLQKEEQVKDFGRGKLSGLVHRRMDLNYMSKRRVPNGPDPIHNRRAGNSGRPPRQG